MTLGKPVTDAPLDFAQKVEASLFRQMSEVANEVCDGMLVACATVFLENSHRCRGFAPAFSAAVSNLYENQPAHDRIRILMTLFGGPRPVEFAAGDIVKV